MDSKKLQTSISTLTLLLCINSSYSFKQILDAHDLPFCYTTSYISIMLPFPVLFATLIVHRITEWQGTEGTSGDQVLQKQAPYSRLQRKSSK